MRVSHVAVASAKAAQVSRLLKRHGFSVVSSKPQAVVAFGGDGTILDAERRYPGVPKLAARNSQHCHLCQIRYSGKHAEELVCWSCLQEGIDAMKTGNFEILERDTLEVSFAGRSLHGLNEVQLHNADPRRAVRFSISVGGRTLAEEIIGDGAILATAFGAGGYFHSVSRQSFSEGLGLALNNPVKPAGPWFFERSLPEVFIRGSRGPAWILVDNNPRKLIVPNGGNIRFRRSKLSARFVALR